MRNLLIISSLIGLSISKPADTCDDQLGCLEVTRDELEDGQRYRVCLKLNNDLYGCNKDGTISHACYSRVEREKIESWGNNEYENPMCIEVDCGSVAEFGLKDGRGCRTTTSLLGQTISGIDGISCSFDKYEGYCGGGNNEDCVWTIPTPDCPSDEPVCDDPNQIYDECGTACPPQCGDGDYVDCGYECIAGCRCKDGFVLNDGDCIRPKNCPTTAPPTTAAPTTSDPTTAAPTTGKPTTAAPTTAKPTTGKPTTASPTIPTCDDENEVYNKCGSLCDRTCDEPNPICAEGCDPRCECKYGYVYNSYGLCIPELECPAPAPSCAATTCEQGVDCCYDNDGVGGCGYTSDDNGGCTEESVEPEPECGGLLPYGATYLGGLYDAVCNPDSYSDPCADAYISGIFRKNYVCCYCEPSSYYAQADPLSIKDVINNNVQDNGEKFTQTQFLLLNSFVSMLSYLLMMALCLTVYCVYTKCKSNKTKQYEFVDEDKV